MDVDFTSNKDVDKLFAYVIMRLKSYLQSSSDITISEIRTNVNYYLTQPVLKLANDLQTQIEVQINNKDTSLQDLFSLNETEKTKRDLFIKRYRGICEILKKMENIKSVSDVEIKKTKN